jgi:hypothetical protein
MSIAWASQEHFHSGHQARSALETTDRINFC